MFKYENIQVLHNQGREVGGDDYNYYVVGGGRESEWLLYCKNRYIYASFKELHKGGKNKL